MRWFGESWGAPVNENSGQVATPVGATCPHCQTEILATDRGLILVATAWHRACLLAELSPPYSLAPQPNWVSST